MVQKAGTINGFNYSYCRILYENALKCLKTDFVYADGETFPINEKALSQFQNKDEAVKRFTDNFDHLTTDENKLKEWRVKITSTTIRLKKDSLLLILIDHISEQLSIESLSGFKSYDGADKIKDLIDRVLTYFDTVRRYLAMFEY